MFRTSTDCSVQRIYPQHIGVVPLARLHPDFLKRMCAVRVWMQLSVRKYFWGPVFRIDTVLVRYCVSFEALSFHGCNYGIFIGWCPCSPWTANRSVVNVYCMSPGRCAPIVESQRVDDFDTDNMARTAVYHCGLNDNMTRTAVYQCRLNYYRYRRINHVILFVVYNSAVRWQLTPLCTVCLFIILRWRFIVWNIDMCLKNWMP